MLDSLNATRKVREKRKATNNSSTMSESAIELALAGTSYDGATISKPVDKAEGREGDSWTDTLPNGRKVRVKRVFVDPSDVYIDDTSINKRSSFTDIKRLAELVKESHGNTSATGIQLTEPSATHGKKYTIIWGKRRTMGTRMAGLPLKSDLYLDPISNEEATILAAMENAGRKDPNYFEKADIYQALLDDGSSKVALSTGEGISRQQLDKLLFAQHFPKELRNKIPNIDKLLRAKCIELGQASLELKKNDINEWNVIYDDLLKQNYLDVENVLTVLRGKQQPTVEKPKTRDFDVSLGTGEQAKCAVKSLKKQTGIAIKLQKTYSIEELDALEKKIMNFIQDL